MSLFKSFQPSKGDIASSTAVKSSVQRHMRTKLLDQYEALSKDDGVLLEQIWPKKKGITLVKFSREHVSFLVNSGEPLFFQHFDGPYLPTLHTLHKCAYIRRKGREGHLTGGEIHAFGGHGLMCYVHHPADPFLMPTIQVDRGAIKFLLSGANVMAPGLLTAGGRLPDSSKGEAPLAKGTPVAILAQDKELPMSIGVLKEGTEEIRAKGKGIVVDNIHCLGGEWVPEKQEGCVSNTRLIVMRTLLLLR